MKPIPNILFGVGSSLSTDINSEFLGFEFTKTVILVVFVSIILEVIFNIFLKNKDNTEEMDERDNTIKLNSIKIAYYTLSIQIFSLIGFLFTMNYIELIKIENLNFLLLGTIMILIYTISSIAKDVYQIYFYRRGY